MEIDDDLDLQALEQPETSKPQLKFKSIHKRVVCRYWLNNKCAKGDHCEFKHEYDTENMPDCKKGVNCPDPSCMLSHVDKEDKQPCPNYEAGFCSFGHSCQYKHVFRPGPPPAIAALFFSTDPAKEHIAKRAKSQKSFRKAKCPYFFSDGWCPYFYACAFSHVA